MKRKTLIIIIVGILLISIGLILIFTNGKNKSTNEVDNGKENYKKKKEKSDNLPPYEGEELYGILTKYASELFKNKEYDKCVKKDDGSCFLSLESLEKNYGKDISKFRDEKRGGCLLDVSGITFYSDNNNPFSLALEGCEFLNSTDEPEPSQLGE